MRVFFRFSVRNARAIAVLLLLSACNFDASIKTDALAYNDAVADTVDKLLVTNILRSRDHAPLHFGAIPNIHEGFQAAGGFATTTPFGPLLPTRTTSAVDVLGLSGGVQTTPSFDMNTLDTKDFITGVSNPIDPKYAKYWLDRNLDPRIVLLLFFASATISEHLGDHEQSIVLQNDPRMHVDNPSPVCTETGYGHTLFDLYLLVINKLAEDHFFANTYTQRRALVTDISLPISGKAPSLRDLGSLLKDVTSLDSSGKYTLVPQSAKKGEPPKYTLYQIASEPGIAFCFNHGNGPERTNSDSDADDESSFCNRSTVDRSLAAQAKQRPPMDIISPPENATDSNNRFCGIFDEFMGYKSAPAGSKLRINLTMRSVGDMIAFLGDLTYYQENLKPESHHHIPMTLGFGHCSKEQPNCAADGGALFWLHKNQTGGRFTVNYQGETYTVDRYSLTDHTLQVLAILDQLLNINKSAQDVRTTPYVEILP